jgi:hypothetical protein
MAAVTTELVIHLLRQSSSQPSPGRRRHRSNPSGDGSWMPQFVGGKCPGDLLPLSVPNHRAGYASVP